MPHCQNKLLTMSTNRNCYRDEGVYFFEWAFSKNVPRKFKMTKTLAILFAGLFATAFAQAPAAPASAEAKKEAKK